jgi:hypothetical protein
MDDVDLLADLDLSQFTDAQRQTIEANLYGQYEDRLGERIVPLINDEKFAQFEAVIDQGDEEKIELWLDQNVPGYENIAQQVLEELKQEVRTDPTKFLQPSDDSLE